MNILIVDDEPLARENLRCLLEEERDIQIIGECANAIEAIGAIHRLKPDVVFLDIQMPRITGLEMVGMLDPEHRPYIVFLTAFDEYAIQAFEEHAFDYLLKPLEKNRLTKTLQRLRQGHQKQDISILKAEEPLKYIPCTGHSRIWLVQQDEVLYVTSRPSGIYVMCTNGQEGFTELTLRTLETRTPLMRNHRQYLVNMTHLREILFGDNGQVELVLRNGQTIPVSRRYLKPLKEALGLK
ncbi:two-component system response regulator BtsR [Photorhabdus temperata]|uniref:two-component system response regulator BtsR n=1 Tax=Photorhabdus temperata TaxID=574560 RepID=UPI00038A40EC|nr:two-component system response regulator BtsR [Photorhabdus temperata]EQC01561.1 two-component response-regulatory protein YehT [Photorhabdus temperata subsp. temperata M1021]